MTYSEKLATEAFARADARIAELRVMIERQEIYMTNRAMSHGMYFSDPYGKAHDQLHLNALKKELKELTRDGS